MMAMLHLQTTWKAENVTSWTWVNNPNYSYPSFDFDSSSSGIQSQCQTVDDSTELDYYLLFFDERIMEKIR